MSPGALCAFVFENWDLTEHLNDLVTEVPGEGTDDHTAAAQDDGHNHSNDEPVWAFLGGGSGGFVRRIHDFLLFENEF